MIGRVKDLILHKDKRSRNIQVNTILNIVFRGLGVLCTFFMVPLALIYIDKTEYGVWLTLTSLTAWLSYMDIGLGNGLRNKLAEAIAENNKVLARAYVSTTYVIFSAVLIGIFILFSIANAFLDWNSILKTNINPKILLLTTYIIVLSFCVRLILDLAGTVALALQKPYLRTLIDFSINLLTLISVYLLSKTSSSSFALFSSAVAIVPVIVLILFNCFLYSGKFSYLKPGIKYFKPDYIKGLLNVGLQFFFIQIVGIVIFSTDNILITQLFSPSDVTTFNIAYKYFSISTIIFSIILLPYWSAFTSSYFQKDFVWIRSAFRKLILLWVGQVLAVVVLVILSGFAFRLWVGDKVSVPVSLSLSLGLYSIICNWNNVFAYFINGVSKIRLQLYSSIFAGIINIPLAYILVKHTDLGVSAIVVANSVCLFISSVWSPVQCYKLINNKAKGIWNK